MSAAAPAADEVATVTTGVNNITSSVTVTTTARRSLGHRKHIVVNAIATAVRVLRLSRPGGRRLFLRALGVAAA